MVGCSAYLGKASADGSSGSARNLIITIQYIVQNRAAYYLIYPPVEEDHDQHRGEEASDGRVEHIARVRRKQTLLFKVSWSICHNIFPTCGLQSSVSTKPLCSTGWPVAGPPSWPGWTGWAGSPQPNSGGKQIRKLMIHTRDINSFVLNSQFYLY